MRLSGRGATPGQPSHISVPAASGGGRGRDVPVLGSFESTELAGWIALQLDEDVVDVLDIGTVPDTLDLSGVMTTERPTIDRTGLSGSTTSDSTTSDGSIGGIGGGKALPGDGTVSADGWICRCFPSLPGCRR